MLYGTWPQSKIMAKIAHKLGIYKMFYIFQLLFFIPIAHGIKLNSDTVLWQKPARIFSTKFYWQIHQDLRKNTKNSSETISENDFIW